MARIIVSVNSESLRDNLALAKSIAKSSKVMAMIKANGYGHGLLTSAKAFEDADAFGVATIDEAITLRKHGVASPITLMQGISSASEIGLVKEYDIDIVVHHPHQVELLRGSEACVKAWVKVNTGFNRLGFSLDVLEPEILKLEKSKVNIIGIMTHYAKANEQDDISVNRQKELFFNGVRSYSYPISMSNSAGLLSYYEGREDWVRPGLMLYGVSPVQGKTTKELGLKSSMSLKAKLISSYKIKKGERVGYGAHFEAKKDMLIGIVSIGYGDGYNWVQNTNAPVVINGQRTYIVGQVSMDMIAISLDNVDLFHIGDYVTLWGNELPIEEVASAFNTSPYAMLCSAPVLEDRALRKIDAFSHAHQ